jgi:hypothetical protein
VSESVYFNEFAEKPACQVNEMYALIDQFPASRPSWLSAPLALIAGPATMPVPGPQEQQRTQYPRIDEAPCLLKRSVIAVIEAHSNSNVALGGEPRQAKQFVDVPRRRFLHENVYPCVYGGAYNLDL